MTQMLRVKAKITPNKTATKTAKKKCFLVFSIQIQKKIAIQQSHIITPYNKALLTSFARSVRESNAFGFYRTDLAPSSLGLYENLRQYFPVQTSHSVNKSLLFCSFTSEKRSVRSFHHMSIALHLMINIRDLVYFQCSRFDHHVCIAK